MSEEEDIVDVPHNDVGPITYDSLASLLLGIVANSSSGGSGGLATGEYEVLHDNSLTGKGTNASKLGVDSLLLKSIDTCANAIDAGIPNLPFVSCTDTKTIIDSPLQIQNSIVGMTTIASFFGPPSFTTRSGCDREMVYPIIDMRTSGVYVSISSITMDPLYHAYNGSSSMYNVATLPEAWYDSLKYTKLSSIIISSTQMTIVLTGAIDGTSTITDEWKAAYNNLIGSKITVSSSLGVNVNSLTIANAGGISLDGVQISSWNDLKTILGIA
jgi:hypothetical protein